VSTPYGSILTAFESIPWDMAPEVTPIRPLARKSIEFFPGHVGHMGHEFPVGGVMLVANNFSSVKVSPPR